MVVAHKEVMVGLSREINLARCEGLIWFQRD